MSLSHAPIDRILHPGRLHIALGLDFGNDLLQLSHAGEKAWITLHGFLERTRANDPLINSCQ
jgi:hypothetical protein